MVHGLFQHLLYHKKFLLKEQFEEIKDLFSLCLIFCLYPKSWKFHFYHWSWSCYLAQFAIATINCGCQQSISEVCKRGWTLNELSICSNLFYFDFDFSLFNLFGNESIPIFVHILKQFFNGRFFSHKFLETQSSIKVSIHGVEKFFNLLPIKRRYLSKCVLKHRLTGM